MHYDTYWRNMSSLAVMPIDSVSPLITLVYKVFGVQGIKVIPIGIRPPEFKNNLHFDQSGLVFKLLKFPIITMCVRPL